ncbi:Pre-mRNA-splicing factor RBM22 [Porphyridium purpureum]|uniref:Pre-mRNA-splicing factor RBM22 n=1 Tax=Porphyridium purpureum TaxID=35688 RepID=A0A5J4YNF8_PORPP|nr:Pre-mRNA-splicing factor RBM22 [Porphyridium purpureum]|eukprot:POR4088..scf222_8
MQEAPTPASTPSFPLLCETCLGPNRCVRMTRDERGRACKVCERPFLEFRWKPDGANTRHKKTEICSTCARAKNVCQTCMFDLNFGLPVAVRDQLFGLGGAPDAPLAGGSTIPQSQKMLEYAAMKNEEAVLDGSVAKLYDSQASNAPILAHQLARRDPKYDRNRAHVCSFFVKGECKRGIYCPYRHDMPASDKSSLSDQKFKNRYYGVDDPLAANILSRAAEKRNDASQVTIPSCDDNTVRSLYVGGIPSTCTAGELVNTFKAFGADSEGVRLVSERGFAFVDFQTHDQASAALHALHNRLELGAERKRVSLNWAKSRAAGAKRGRPTDSEARGARERDPKRPTTVPLPSESPTQLGSLPRKP